MRYVAPPMGVRLVLAAALALAACSCNRNIEPYVEGEKPSPPDLARIFPDTGDGPGASATAAQMGGPRVGATPPSARPGQNAPLPAGGDAAGAMIRGRIELPPDLAGALRPDATLFVIARRAGAQGGPPLAVLRIPGPRLPYAFEIGQRERDDSGPAVRRPDRSVGAARR